MYSDFRKTQTTTKRRKITNKKTQGRSQNGYRDAKKDNKEMQSNHKETPNYLRDT